MTTYTAPLRDLRFVYEELFDAGEITALEDYQEATPDLVNAIVEEGAKLCQNELFPLNRSGDEEGCHFDNGNVRTPEGFRSAYAAYLEGGWGGLNCAPEFGGLGLPEGKTMWDAFGVQAIGLAATIAWSAVATYILVKITAGLTSGIRVREDDELEGLDITAHGETAYRLD